MLMSKLAILHSLGIQQWMRESVLWHNLLNNSGSNVRCNLVPRVSLSLPFPCSSRRRKEGWPKTQKRRLVFFFNEPIKPETVKLGQRFCSDTKWRKINGVSILYIRPARTCFKCYFRLREGLHFVVRPALSTKHAKTIDFVSACNRNKAFKRGSSLCSSSRPYL